MCFPVQDTAAIMVSLPPEPNGDIPDFAVQDQMQPPRLGVVYFHPFTLSLATAMMAACLSNIWLYNPGWLACIRAKSK
mgnify:CR=1 FL=1